jgi:hypothetical protein
MRVLFDNGVPRGVAATLWQLRFPRTGDAYEGCEWVDVFAQGVPAHIRTPTPGYGYGSMRLSPMLPVRVYCRSRSSRDLTRCHKIPTASAVLLGRDATKCSIGRIAPAHVRRMTRSAFTRRSERPSCSARSLR